MLSKSQIKFITQLKQKKYRIKHNCFVAEGPKVIDELLQSHFNLKALYTTKSFGGDLKQQEVVISEGDLKKVSFLKTPNTALAIFEIPETKTVNTNSLIVALDNVRDPGNLGTIIRLCDWFGIEDLICNTETVDCYNPKVVQATMGSLSRVNISYLNLLEFLSVEKVTSMGAFMDGNNIYEDKLPSKGVLVLGNEANGISSTIEDLMDYKVSIPRFGKLQSTESLNVATATAILLAEFKRQSIEM